MMKDLKRVKDVLDYWPDDYISSSRILAKSYDIIDYFVDRGKYQWDCDFEECEKYFMLTRWCLEHYSITETSEITLGMLKTANEEMEKDWEEVIREKDHFWGEDKILYWEDKVLYNGVI